MKQIEASELILNPDGSIYHLKLRPENIADDIILVGDPGRVEMVSSFFSKVDFKVQNREFVTHTGTYNGKRVSVISTGIGCDNIDIVVNELDALVNIDLEKRIPKDTHHSLNLVRIGTSGALQADIPVDTPVISKITIGFDGLINFYAGRNSVCDLEFENAFVKHTGWNKILPAPYVVHTKGGLFGKLSEGIRTGATIATGGFYGPQGRVLRLPIIDSEINSKIEQFEFKGDKIINYEMESSAIYGLSALLGHDAVTLCAIIANRMRKEYSKDYKIFVKKLVQMVLDRLTA
ncbi:MAG: phosphorylase [Bacteroidetes bacterium GWA2_31_9]|nr:MAG: phosphorylase [Bacteroidetes bacterium GWA2_31_9]